MQSSAPGIPASPEAQGPGGPGTLRSLIASYYGPSLTVLTFCLLTWLTWRKWPDILIDFGRELYVPWRLIQGEVLYRDLAYLNGPFSPYLNALWFHLFGASFLTLALCNLFLLGLLTGIIYYLVCRTVNHFTATLTSITFLSVFAFGHLVGIGNYNFVSPYSHEMTHGLLLSFVIILLFTFLMKRFSYTLILLIGLLMGLIFLGKGEIFAAAVLATLTGLASAFMAHRCSGKKILVSACIFLLAFLIPLTVALAALSSRMSLDQALRGVVGTWAGVFASPVSDNLFYRQCLGVDQPGRNMLNMAAQFAGVLLLVAALVVADKFRKEPPKLAWLLAPALLVLGAVMVKRPLTPWILTGPALPLFGLGISLALIGWCIRNRSDHAALQNIAPLAVWSVFGLGLLAKIFLNSRLAHYGFALAMPATLMVVVALAGLGFLVLSRRYRRGDFYRFFLAALIMADVAYYLTISWHFYRHKTLPVGRGADAIMAFSPDFDPRSAPTAQLLGHLETLSGLENFLVLPEGIMLNYLVRKPCPNKFLNFMPPEVLIYGEGAMLRALADNPPQYLVLIPKDTKEYGFAGFGRDPRYGERIMAWIGPRYEPVWQVALKGSGAGDIKLLKNAGHTFKLPEARRDSSQSCTRK